ncbi:MAG TPA: prepilin-type N-terminal cleavage/methylation domain-containing protein [Bryobacteraceae bacterium]|nr:prepilin-type N-terminal cleavage/methylation domain-containing protein [Bryobacteraceae bacterium]
MSRRPGARGFTLLEVLVATVILATAIAGLMTSLSGSVRVASRLTEYDRAAMLAHRKMEELTTERRLRRFTPLEGAFDPAQTNGAPSGWRAMVAPFEAPPNPAPGIPIVERIAVTVWWTSGGQERTYDVEGFRRYYLKPEDIVAGAIQR